ncbi:MAG: hypothetical protein SFU86_20970 [Pirellulaceae bacterium]|nr:hypothetical protein [Pirellulaceae bacterium]
MKALRSLALLAILALPVALPLASPTPAAAGHGHAAQVRYYYLYYRTCPHDSWHYYGATANYSQLVAYAHWIRGLGYETYAY